MEGRLKRADSLDSLALFDHVREETTRMLTLFYENVSCCSKDLAESLIWWQPGLQKTDPIAEALMNDNETLY